MVTKLFGETNVGISFTTTVIAFSPSRESFVSEWFTSTFNI
jgi:hypothetical protein